MSDDSSSARVLPFRERGGNATPGEQADANGTAPPEDVPREHEDAWRRGFQAGMKAALARSTLADESYGRALAALWRINAEMLERAEREAEELAVELVGEVIRELANAVGNRGVDAPVLLAALTPARMERLSAQVSARRAAQRPRVAVPNAAGKAPPGEADGVVRLTSED